MSWAIPTSLLGNFYLISNSFFNTLKMKISTAVEKAENLDTNLWLYVKLENSKNNIILHFVQNIIQLVFTCSKKKKKKKGQHSM